MTEPQYASYASIIEWRGCICHRCGCPYRVDLIVSDDIWAEIKPDASRDGGLLCGRCIVTALEARGFGAWKLTDLSDTPPPKED